MSDPARHPGTAQNAACDVYTTVPPFHYNHRPKRTKSEVARDIFRFFTAPFVTLAFLPLFPIIGVMTLIRTARDNQERRKQSS